MSQKAKAAVLAVLILVAAGVFFMDSGGVTGAGKTLVFKDDKYSPLAVENPELQRWKLDSSRKTEYRSSGRDLFSESLPPAPVKQRQPAPQLDPTPALPAPDPPPSLPANMKYYGYGTIPNGTAKRAFLTDGESVYIVGEGDTLLGRYRILRITNASLEFEEMGSGRRNSAPLDEQAAPGN